MSLMYSVYMKLVKSYSDFYVTSAVPDQTANICRLIYIYIDNQYLKIVFFVATLNYRHTVKNYMKKFQE